MGGFLWDRNTFFCLAVLGMSSRNSGTNRQTLQRAPAFGILLRRFHCSPSISQEPNRPSVVSNEPVSVVVPSVPATRGTGALPNQVPDEWHSQQLYPSQRRPVPVLPREQRLGKTLFHCVQLATCYYLPFLGERSAWRVLRFASEMLFLLAGVISLAVDNAAEITNRITNNLLAPTRQLRSDKPKDDALLG